MQQPKGILDRVLQFMGIQEVGDDVPDGRAVTESNVSSVQPKPVAATSERLAATDRSERITRLDRGDRTERIDRGDRRKGRLVSLPGPGRTVSQFKLAVLKPQDYDEVDQIADHLKENQPVVISLEGLDHATSQRIIDFVSGAVYALDGGIQRVAEGIFVVAPNNVSIDADLARSWNEGELFT